MSTPIRHHYAPVFYLQQWATTGGKLVEFSKVRSKLINKLVGPQATGFQSELYTLEDLPPESQRHLESSFFNSIDNAGSKALNIHLGLSNEAWTFEKRNAWSLFLMSMQLRHPDALPELISVLSEMWDEGDEEFERKYQSIRAPHHPKTYEDYLKQRGPHDDAWGRVSVIEHAFKEAFIRDRLNAMKWEVFDTSEADHALLTSDRPILFWDLEGIDGFVAMLLSPSKVFIAANGKHNIDYIRSCSPNELVHKNNKLVVEQARKFVWGADASLAEFVEKYMSTRLEKLPVLSNPGQPARGKPSP